MADGLTVLAVASSHHEMAQTVETCVSLGPSLLHLRHTPRAVYPPEPAWSCLLFAVGVT